MVMIIIKVLLLLLSALFAFLVVLWLYQKYKYRNVKIPTPKAVPIIGNVFNFEGSPDGLLNGFINLSKTYGGIFKLYMGPSITYIIISDPKYLTELLNSQEHVGKSFMYGLYKLLIKDGLISCQKALWKPHRKLYSPSFSTPMLDGFTQTFNSIGDNLVKTLMQLDGDVVDIKKYCEFTALNAIIETVLGSKFKENQDMHMSYMKNVNLALKCTMVRMFSIWKRYDCLFQFSSEFKEHARAIDYVNNYTMNIIKSRIAELKEYNNQAANVATTDEFGIKKRSVVMDVWIDLYERQLMTLEDIKYEVNSFTVAGFDTTGNAMQFLLFELSRRPDVQKRIYEEVSAITDNANAFNFTMKQLSEMKYLECVVKETLRLYTPAPFIDRCLDRDLQIGDLVIPKHTNIGILIYGIHHNKEYYTNPEKFDPDRFLPEPSSKRHPLAFIPFSHGPRNCIGYRYAQLEIKCVIAKIVQNFYVINEDPNFEIEVMSTTILQSKNGFGSIKFLHR